RPLSLLFCDLDRFKAVNDTYGHAIGDALLVQAAQRIRAVVRPGDTVARMGGDEFVVICEDLGDDSGEVIAARMRAALEQPFRLSVGQVRIGASIGVATAAAEDLSVEGLLALADERMYAEKHAVARAPEGDRPLLRSAPELSGLAGGQVERILELARRHLDMDAVHISQFTDGQQVHRAVGGDAGSFGLVAGSANALDAGYCHRMVCGEIPQVIPDTAAEEGVCDLPVTTAAGLGAYIGVPLRLSDGTMYGTFCCLSHNERPDLDSRDLGFMQMLAALLVDDLDVQHTAQQRRQGLTDIVRAERVTMALQPIVDLSTGRCAGFEALARFPAPAGPPDTVFALARETGLDLDLQLMTARRALAVLPLLGPGQRLGVNVTPDIAVLLAGSAIFEDVPVEHLVLEITEHQAVESYAELREQLEPLRARGLQLAIDDAGAGYASLHHIVELRPDIIKIDGSLVNGLASDAARRSAVLSLVLLGQELGAAVVAEGIETHADLAAARSLGVGAAQGYLLARPSTDPGDHAYWAAGPDLLAAASAGI
ncbi:MAG: hypothetical protein JWN87_670, partial [Frankiales bacterium]|nr:hypothetical protein [Frankiales bacterium]